MPHSKSSQKQVRAAERKTIRNKSTQSLCKTAVTKVDRLVFSSDLEEAKKAADSAISSLDKAAEKGVIHRNNAARRKSRLMKRLNQAIAVSTSNDESGETE